MHDYSIRFLPSFYSKEPDINIVGFFSGNTRVHNINSRIIVFVNWSRRFMGKPKPKQEIDKGELVCFVGTAYGHEPAKRISTTRFDFTFSGGAVVYRSKAKTINVLSST